jgi:hypothetical protein
MTVPCWRARSIGYNRPMPRSGPFPSATPFDPLRWVADAEPSELLVGPVSARFDGAGVRFSIAADEAAAAYVFANQTDDVVEALRRVTSGGGRAVGGPFEVLREAGRVRLAYDVDIDGRCWRVDSVPLAPPDAERLADWLCGLPRMPLVERMLH